MDVPLAIFCSRLVTRRSRLDLLQMTESVHAHTVLVSPSIPADKTLTPGA